MSATCEEFANEYQIDSNPTKSKLICFNANIDHTPHIILNGQPVSVVRKDKHLGNYISSSINDRHISENTCDLYQRSNLLISQFRPCNQGRIGPAAPPPLRAVGPRLNHAFFYELICCETYLNYNM